MFKFIVGGIIILLVIVGAVFLLRNSSTQSVPTPQISNTSAPAGIKFSNPVKSAHYVSNTPVHGSTLAGVPINVVIDFNFDLAKPSEIKILKDGKDYAVGQTLIDDNKLALRRSLNSNAPDGKYSVEYKACWPDKTCHDGSFEFAIDRSKASGFLDQTDKKEVTIRISNIAFKPQNIKISKGTKVTWINDEAVGHYVNTDPHPGHSYYPAQNSQLLQKGESFSLTFTQTGIYPYHCSAHASNMLGTILVE